MMVDRLVHEANARSGEDLGRVICAEVRDALRAGVDRGELIAAVEMLHDRLGEAGREDDQDAVAEVLDSLTGFTSPAATL